LVVVLVIVLPIEFEGTSVVVDEAGAPAAVLFVVAAPCVSAVEPDCCGAVHAAIIIVEKAVAVSISERAVI
jgi:hypothetical protein